MPHIKKIKVVEVIPTLDPGGAENVTKFICKYLDRSKFDLTVFCFYKTPKHSWPKDIRIIFLNKMKGMDFGLIARLKSNLKKIKPDIIHCHNLNSILYIIPICLFNKKIKLIQTIHSDLGIHSGRLLWRLIFNLFKIFTVNLSPRLNEQLQKGKRNYNISNGIELIEFRNVPKHKIDKHIINIGRLEKTKNHIFLINIFRYIINCDRNYTMLIIGRGTMEKKIRSEIKKLHLGKNVRMIAKPVHSAKYLKKSDFYISSSAWEGMPLTIIEALACGLIVFSTPAGAIEDLIENNQNGFIYRGNSAKGFAELFLNKTNNKPRLNRIRKNARKTSRLFSAQKMTKKYEKLFKKLYVQNY